MKRGTSTGKPTKAEEARIVACKEGVCIACHVWAKTHPWIRAIHGCDYHHLKSGNIRRGHRFGIGLCGWHHRRLPLAGILPNHMALTRGPSLMDGSRKFHETYGTDDELLKIQDELIGWVDA